MFIDGLSNNKDMRPVRNVNGLVCKACHLGLGNAPHVQEERKTFSLPQLVNHFQSKHVEPMQAQGVYPLLDWVLDMVLLPDLETLSGLRTCSKPQKEMLADALPHLFQPRSASAQQQPSPYPMPSKGRHIELSGQGMNGLAGRDQPYSGPSAAKQYSLADYQSNRGFGNVVPPPLTNGGSDAPQNGYVSEHQPNFNSATPNTSDHPRDVRLHPAIDGAGLSFTGSKKVDAGAEAWNQGWSTSRTEFGEPYSSYQNPDAGENTERPREASLVQRPGTRTPPRPSMAPIRTMQPSSITGHEEVSNLQHQGLPSAVPQRHRDPSDRPYTVEHAVATASGAAPPPRIYDRYDEGPRRSRSPVYDVSYQPVEQRRQRSPLTQQVALAYISGVGVRPHNDEMEYGRYRSQTVVPEYFSRRADTEIYDRPPRQEYHDLDQNARLGYYRNRVDARSPSRPPPPPPVDTYEIVQVRDERGEYLIRRPMRREAAAQSFHDVGRKVYRDADPYGAVPFADSEQPVYSADSRGPPAGAYTRHDTVMRADTQRGTRGDDRYYEEYDPRFPAAS